ncbi:hypothetical protein [Telmatospirillum sp. J64-1]|uniref:hypothetical protein n=1 Tax=Telmatospirillum sp. J64-1 TaxID=2502183 RepID=UPI00115E7370|nr:hypothetical protein [Telmatospirillum sp. J64-1]
MKRHRYALAMMAGAYPLIVCILYLLPAELANAPHWLKALFIVPVMVLGMVYAVNPLVLRLCGPWLGLRKE